MKPIEFEEQNTDLKKPESMTDEECSSLPCFRDGNQVISKWELNEEEKEHVAKKGWIWVRVFAGMSSPPISIEATNTVFE